MLRAPASEMHSFLRLLVIFSIAISAVFVCRYGYMIITDVPGALFAHDYRVFYRAAQVFSVWPPSSPYVVYTGEELLDYVAVNKYHPYLNPPFLLFALWPLYFLSYHAGLIIFLFAQMMLWVAVLHTRSVRALWPALSQHEHYSWIAIAVSLPFASNTLMVGQLGVLYASLLLFGTALLPKRPFISGMVLAFVACKPTLALLLPFLLVGGRHWRACLAFGLTGLLLGLAATLVWGLSIWVEWLQVVGLHGEVMRQPALPEKFAMQMISPYAGLRILGMEATPALILQAIATVAGGIAVFYAAWKNRPYPAQLALLYASLFMVNGYVLQYDAMILAAAVLVFLNTLKPPLTRASIILLLSTGIVVPQFQDMGIPAAMMIILLFWTQCLRNIGPSASTAYI